MLITSFILSFGITKALIDLISGQLADHWGRKPVLVLGWLAALPVPFLIIYAPSWSWIIAANVLLGINQGFAWSMTVLMTIDLAGPARRGLAMGLNEFAGYGAVGLTAILTGYIAASAGLRPKPFYLGIGYAIVGLLLSLLFARETRGHMEHESQGHSETEDSSTIRGDGKGFWQVFAITSWKDKTLFGTCQAGLVDNLNDGVAWGVFPLFFAAHGCRNVDTGPGPSSHCIGRETESVGQRPRGGSPSWFGHRNGLPVAFGRGRRCRSPELASSLIQYLPFLARYGLCRRCVPGRNDWKLGGASLGHSRGRHAHFRIRPVGMALDARNANKAQAPVEKKLRHGPEEWSAILPFTAWQKG